MDDHGFVAQRKKQLPGDVTGGAQDDQIGDDLIEHGGPLSASQKHGRLKYDE